MNTDLKWPVADIKSLYGQMGAVPACQSCQRISQVWFKQWSQKELDTIDVGFPNQVEQLFYFTYYPRRLWTREPVQQNCDPCKKIYAERCLQFRKENPQSALSPLLSFVSTIPTWEVTQEPR